jgi:LemA protein
MALALFALLAVTATVAILLYNSLARLRLLADNAWADIDVQLKRRHDLIPGLVAAVEGHAGYERSTLEAVVAARTRAAQAPGPASSGTAESVLADSVRQIFAVAEAYPDLRATRGFLDLQHSLTDIEDHVQQARRYYNAVVRDLNTRIAQFPANLIAAPFGFRPREFFGLGSAAERAAPELDLEGGR